MRTKPAHATIALALILASGCVREHPVELVIRREGSSSDAAISVEIYEGRVCGRTGTAMLIVSGPLEAGTSLPSLAPGTYTIVVRARSPGDCVDVGYVCSEVTLSDQPVEVTLMPATDSTGCPPGTICSASGQCIPMTNQCREGTSEGCESTTGQMCCAGACIDRLNDPNHCGGCGIACATGECVNGSCGGTAEHTLHVDASEIIGAGQPLRVEAFWYQLDSSLAIAEQPIASEDLVDGGSIADLPIAVLPSQIVRFCDQTCPDGGCTCETAAQLAFGFVRVREGDLVIGYADAVLVWSSRDLSADELSRGFGRMGLDQVLSAGVLGGVSAYRLSSFGGAALEATGFDTVYPARRMCDTVPDCPVPIARRP